MPILTAARLHKVYRRGNDAVVALREADFALTRGEFAAILGPSGSGKSTLLQIVAGLLRPSGGSVVLDGVELTTADDATLARLRRQKLGFVFQHFDLLAGLTARENILVPALLDGRRPDPAVLDALVTRLGIADRLDHLPAALSGGQMQRVAIARALINAPDLLIADEPTGSLDPASAAELVDLLADLHREGRTILLVTHDPAIAARADTVYCMTDGVLTKSPRKDT